MNQRPQRTTVWLPPPARLHDHGHFHRPTAPSCGRLRNSMCSTRLYLHSQRLLFTKPKGMGYFSQQIKLRCVVSAALSDPNSQLHCTVDLPGARTVGGIAGLEARPPSPRKERFQSSVHKTGKEGGPFSGTSGARLLSESWESEVFKTEKGTVSLARCENAVRGAKPGKCRFREF